MAKQFLLFAGDNYYPRPAWMDFKGAFSTLDEALNHLRTTLFKGGRLHEFHDPDWIQIVDTSQMKVVWEGEKDVVFYNTRYEGGTFFKQIPVYVEGD